MGSKKEKFTKKSIKISNNRYLIHYIFEKEAENERT